MYITQGVDGLFVEFPIDSERWFTDLGNHSTLDFDKHPGHFGLESKDINLETTKTCIADQYQRECMSYETLFSRADRKNAFLAPKGQRKQISQNRTKLFPEKKAENFI